MMRSVATLSEATYDAVAAPEPDPRPERSRSGFVFRGPS